jgi:CHASE2 domain-containing sensor protein/signal transduction histidine kinase
MGVLGFACIATQQNWLWRVDLTLYDAALALWKRPAPSDIIIVAVDEEALAQIGRWPWRRAVHAALVDKLGEARAVALDLILSEPDRGDPRGDEALTAAIRRNGRVVLPVLAEDSGGELRETRPIAAFAEAAAALGHIHLELDADGTGRSVYLKEGPGAPQHLHLAAALLQTGEGREIRLPGERNLGFPVSPGAWVRDHLLRIPFAGPPGHFQRVSVVDVLRAGLPPVFFRDKLALVGVTAEGLGEAHPTPVSAHGRAMPGVEIVANVVDALRSGIVIGSPARWLLAALSCLPPLLALIACLRFTPRRALAFNALLTLAVLGLSLAGPRLFEYWIPPSAALLALGLCYPLWSWRRLEAAQRYLDRELEDLRARPGLALEQASAHSKQSGFTIDAIEGRIEAVENALARLRTLRRFIYDSLASAPDGALVASKDGRIALANSRAGEYLGELPTLEGRKLAGALSILHASADWEALVESIFAGRRVEQVEARDASGRDLLASFAPCHSASEEVIGIIVTLTDVSALKTAQRSRDEALRFLSHDLRSPQASILATLELCRAAPQALSVTEALARVERYARATLDLANDFVLIARAEDASPEQFAEHDLAQLLHDAADAAWALAASKDVRLERRIEPREALVRGDRSMLYRAVLNLLSNAVRHSPGGTTTTLSLACEGKEFICTVADPGCGIAAEDLPRLFQRFQQLGRRELGAEDGVGLGLVFVKIVAEKHGGSVSVASTPGAGSRFSLQIPAAEP